MSIQYLGQTARYSEAVIANGLVFLSGMVAEDLTADISGQTRDVLKQIDDWLHQSGSDKNHLLEATIYLRDMNDYAAMNAEWDAWVGENHAPARACVEAKMAKPEYAVEIKVSAIRISK